MSNEPPSDLFKSDRHALYAGWVIGVAMRNGVDLSPVVDDHGNYTDCVTVTVPDGTVLTLVIPAPPDDWTFPEED